MLGAIASVIGFFGSLFSWFTGAQQRKIGAQAQALKDDEATIKAADTARQVDSGVGRLSDAAIDDKLREYSSEK